MGQSSSQLEAPSQQIEVDIKRTPTPNLSDIESTSEPTSGMETPHLGQEHTTTTTTTGGWSAINAETTRIDAAVPPASTATSPPPATTSATSQTKVTKKRASDSTQRRLRSPRSAKAGAPDDSSEEDQRSSQRLRRALPAAALDEGDAPVLRATSAKRAAFSPLRRTRPPPRAPHSPPPRVIIPSREIAAATQAQALEHHVEALQQQLSRAQSQLQSPARPSVPPSRLTSPLKSSTNLLSASQNATQGDDWFSRIDAAVAEVAEDRRLAVEMDDVRRSTATRQDSKMVKEKKGLDLTQGEQSADVDVSGAEGEMEVHEGVEKETEDEVEEEAEEDVPEAGTIEKVKDNEDWPLPTMEDIAEHLQQRPLTADDLEFEAPIEEPQSDWESRENVRRTARNVLREHIVKWNLERKVYKGLAKYVSSENAESVIVYAAPGVNFNTVKHSKTERREAKARKESMKGIRTALHESIVGSELELRKMAERTSLGAHGGDAESVSAEDLIAAQPSCSARDADSVDMPALEDVDAKVDNIRGADLEGRSTAVDPVDHRESSSGAVQTPDLDDDPDIGPAAAQNLVPEPTRKPEPSIKQRKGKGKRLASTELSEAAGGEMVTGTTSDPVSKKHRKVGPAVPNAPIPTPPKSDKNEGQALGLPSQPASVQVHDWLASQNEAHAVPTKQEPSAAKTSRKRKRKSSAHDVPAFEEVAPEDSNSVTTSTREMQKAKRSLLANGRRSDGEDDSEAPKSKKRKSNSEAAEGSSKPKRVVTMSGPFTQEEKELADKIFDSVLQKEGLRESELVARIQNWKTCGTLKTDMFAAFSDRSVESVRKFCQRRWHGQERGPWTADQDEALQKAYVSQPGKWTVISDSVGRTAADCKDRWRSHFESDQICRGPWTVEEEEQLMAAVEECINVIKKEKRDDPALLRDRERLEALISWRVVSDKLDGKRTTVRCREKYAKIRATQAKMKNHDVSWSTTQREKGGDDPQKVAMARRKVEQFEIGDFYDVFVEIHSSFQDPHQHFRDEKNVVWSIVSAKNLHSRFSGHAYSSSLRRVALETAVKTWPANNPKIKKKLEKVDTVPAKAILLAKWIEKTYAGRLDTIARTYQTDYMGKSKEELQALKQARREKFAQGPRKGNGKSKDYITDSEEEEDDSAVSSLGEASDANDDEDDEASAKKHDAERSDVSLNVPASQFQEDNDMTMTDVESLKGTPSIGPANFVDRLKASGGSGRRETVGYGKRDKAKAARRRSHVQ